MVAVAMLAAVMMQLVASGEAVAGAKQGAARPFRQLRAPTSTDIYDGSGRMDANALEMVVTNMGSFGHDYLFTFPSTLDPGAGLHYPRGTAMNVIYAGGLWLGGVANSARRVAVAEYAYGYPAPFEYVPGPMSGGFNQDDQPPFRNYRIERGNTSSSDYLNWPVSQGAPTDSLGLPLVLGDLTLWSVYNDADPTAHISVPGMTAVLGVEIQQTTFAFNRAGPLGRAIFIRFKLINKGYNDLDSAYVALWCDPDIGDLSDDLVGCDTTRTLAYGYNGGEVDLEYGASPPAAGYALLQGPVVNRGGGASDTLGMTSLISYTIGGDPMAGIETFNLMKGLHRDGTPMYVNNDPLQPTTTYYASGDPVTGTGWLDGNPGDRRFMMSSGPFTMAVGDSQEIVMAVLVGQGSDRLASVADLRAVYAAAVDAYRSGFNVPQDVPTAIAMYLVDEAVSSAQVVLRWRVPDRSGVIGVVQRREPGTDWQPVSDALTPDGSVIRFEDTSVTPGARYGYRLLAWAGVEQDSSTETWVTVPDAPSAPTVLTLEPSRPNPTSGASRWSYYLPLEGHARLAVWDARGRLVRVLCDGESPKGWHGVVWDGRDESGANAASGLYFARLESVGRVTTRKFALAR